MLHNIHSSGRVFKHSPAIALEFLAQKPGTDFIATAEQWAGAGYPVKTGGNSIHFVDENGKHSDLLDFSQVKGDFPPPRWTLNVETAAQVKDSLGIPSDSSLIKGITSQMITNSQIVDCMAKLEIPPKGIEDFRKSYISSVQTVLAGRLEVGGCKFNIMPDSTMFQELQKDSQGMEFLAMVSESAKEILLRVEAITREMAIMKTENNQERGESNDFQGMEQTHGGTAEPSAGERTADNPAVGVEERT